MSDDKPTLTHIIGNLGKDPEKKFIESLDKSVVEVSVGVTMSYGSKDEPDSGVTRWVQVAVWKTGLFSQVLKLKKGAKIAAEGVMKVEVWEGKKQYRMSASRIGTFTPFLKQEDEDADDSPPKRAAKKSESDEELSW